MAEVCELLVTTKEGQLVAGIIELKGGVITSGYSDGYERLVLGVLEAPVFGVERESNPELWFEALPLQYSGSYFRAEILGDVKAYGTSEGVTKAWDTRGRGSHAPAELVPGVRKMEAADMLDLRRWRNYSNNTPAGAQVKRSMRKAANVADWLVDDWEDEHAKDMESSHSEFYAVQSRENGLVGAINVIWDTSPQSSGYAHVASLATRPDVIAGAVKERGVGTKLMLQAARQAASLGQGLDLSALNGAEGFYRKLGMHETPPVSRDHMSTFRWTPAEVQEMAKGTVN